MKNVIILTLIILTTFISSCGGSDDGGGIVVGDDGGNDNIPQAASLVFPLKNVECNEGKILSKTESLVTFEWNAAELTDSYTVSLTNLETNIKEEFSTANTTLEIKLLRGTPYSWKVISKVNGSAQIAQSDTWNLYNAGPGTENYAPFPATLISPQMGLSVSGSNIVLEWQGSDADDDIDEYEIYMDTTSPPTTLRNTQKSSTFSVPIPTKTVYYWQIVTKDKHGNSTKSPVFEFKKI